MPPGRSEARRALAAISVAAALLSSASAGADPPSASLIVTRDEGARDCVDAEGLAAQVRAIVGRHIIARGPLPDADTWIQVELTRALDGYRALIQTRGRRSGSRVISDLGPGCGNLADAVSIALAVLLDPGVEPPAPKLAEPPAASSVPVPPAQAAPTATPVVPSGPSPPESKLGFGVELNGGLAMGVLRDVVPTLDGALRVRPAQRLVLSIGGGLAFPDSVALGDERIELDLAFAYLRACLVLLEDGRGSALGSCLQPMAGSLHGSGHGFDDDSNERLPWGAIAGGLAAHGSLGGLSWAARAFVLSPFVRQGFSVERNGEVSEAFATPPIGALFALGIFHGS